jgi:hypothetical protein
MVDSIARTSSVLINAEGGLSDMSEAIQRQRVAGLGFLQIAIIVLAIVTALVHLDRGITTSAMMSHAGAPPPGAHRGPGGPGILAMIPIPLPILFYLNFLAYIILAALLYLPALRPIQNVLRWLLIILAAVTIIMWYLITGGMWNILSIIDKPVELALIILLLIDWRQSVQASKG